MDKSKVAVFVCSPNSYSDVLQIFIECMKKNWPNCPYDFILATNDQSYPNIKVINNYKKSDGWTDRALPVLKSINYEYVILLCDDAFISKPINNSEIDSILNVMEQKGFRYCRLKHYRHGKNVKELSLLSYLNMQSAYGLNLYKGIFRRDYLIEIIGDGTKTCWQLEMDWNSQSSKAPNEFYTDLASCTKEVIPTIHGLEKGKWFPSAIRKLKKGGMQIQGNREVMSFQSEMIYQIKTELGNAISPRNRKKLKRILQRIGVRFTTEN